jgi:hypothetical protein
MNHGFLALKSSVFKPRTRLGSRVLIGTPDFDQIIWVNLIFFINQNDFVLIKNKKIVNRLQSGF